MEDQLALKNFDESQIGTEIILEMTPTIVFFLDRKNIVKEISTTACEYFGLSGPDDARGKKITALITDPVLLLLMKRWVKTLNAGSLVEESFPIVRQGSNKFEWYSIKAKPAYRDGRIIGKCFFLNNVTELYTQKNILDTLMVSIPGTVLVFDRDFHILFSSDALAQENGFSTWRDLTGRSLRELSSLNVEEIEIMLDQLILTETPIQQIIKTDRPDVGIRWFHADLRILKSFAGNFGFILTLFDTTNEIKPKAILEALMDSATDIITIVNPQGTIEYISQNLVDALGFDDWRSLVNKPWEKLLKNTGKNKEKFAEFFSGDSFTDAQQGQKTLTLEEPDGKRFLNYRFQELNYQKESFGYINIATNATALVNAREQAELATRAKATFLANMTHELRTPMNAVLGINELLSRTTLTALQRNYVAQVRSSATMLLSVINEILDFSKIEAKKMELIVAPYKTMDLIQDVVNLIGVRMNEKELSFTVDVDPSTPSVLEGDSLRIKQLLINLLGNAVKFTSEGFVSLFVSGTKVGTTVMLTLTVQDTGVGIPKEKQADLFKEFSRVDNALIRPIEGSGLGLSICRALVTMMGGTLSLESVEGKGSSFSAIFPQGLVENAEPVVSFPYTEPVHLLLFEQDEIKRASLARMAEEAGVLADFCEDLGAFTQLMDRAEFPWTHIIFDYGSAYDQVLPFVKKHPAAHWLALLELSDFVTQEKAPSVSFLFNPLLITGFESFIKNEYVDFSSSLSMLNPLNVAPQYFCVSNARVLVVDDNAVNRKVAEGFLRSLEIQVDKASSGKEALKKAASTVYDLVLMDHVMPEMDGIETVRRLRKEKGYEKTPIIMFTANSSNEFDAEYKACGVNGTIHKPIEFNLFLECMEKWLKNKPETQGVKKELETFENDKHWIPSLDKNKAIEYTGSEENLAVILKIFARSAPKLLEALEETHRGSDRDAYHTAAHSLISVSANIGGMTLSTKARELEQAILKEEKEVAERVYPEVRDNFAELIIAVKKYVEEQSSLDEKKEGR